MQSQEQQRGEVSHAQQHLVSSVAFYRGPCSSPSDHYPQKCGQYRVPASQTLNVFTRYTDYIGQFVMHCHILDHEDLGMVEVGEVVGEQPAVLPSHGGH